MEFDLNFDDSLFDTGKEAKEDDKLLSYNVKNCEPMWFDKELCSSTSRDESKMQSLKFSADCHYFNSEYEKAISGYKQVIELIPAHISGSLKRDVNESLARSFLQLNRTAEAMQLCNSLLQSAHNGDQEYQALYLLREVYHQANNIQGEIEVLQKLLTGNHMNAKFWIDLASGYRQLMLMNSDNEHTAHTGRESQVELCSLSCLIRARLVLQNALLVTRSFVSEQMSARLKQVEESIDELNIEKDIKERAEKFISHDLRYSFFNAEDNDDEEKETKKVQRISRNDNKSFEDTWFRWLKTDRHIGSSDLQ